MTLNVIDQALTVALTGSIYGSGSWLACAFGLYLVSQQRKKNAAAATLTPQLQASVLEASKVKTPKAETSKTETPKTESIADGALPTEEKAPSIEIIIEQPAVTSPIVKRPVITHPKIKRPVITASAVSSSAVTTEHAAAVTRSVTRRQPKHAAAKAAVLPIITEGVPSRQQKIQAMPIKPPEIVCEPVNWKKWRVADLRKANIANVCGVRTRPIGSRRNLPKADLIAQYEQQLKRLTHKPPTQSGGKEDVA